MITTLQNTCQSLEQQLNDLMNSKEMNAKELDEKVQEERFDICFFHLKNIFILWYVKTVSKLKVV